MASDGVGLLSEQRDKLLALARNRQQYLGFTVDLMNVLGGGWAPRYYEPRASR